MVGATQLVWQFTVFLIFIISFGHHFYVNCNDTTEHTFLFVHINTFFICTLSIVAVFLGVYLRSIFYVIERIIVTDYLRLGIDLLHYFFIFMLFIFCLVSSRNKYFARITLIFIMILDISLATSRYYFDNERLILPQSAWPFTLPHFKQGNAEDLFKPDQNDGSLKGDFWQPFTGSFRPPPNVSRLRASWGIFTKLGWCFPHTGIPTMTDFG